MFQESSNLTRGETVTVWTGSTIWICGVLAVSVLSVLHGEQAPGVLATVLAVLAIGGFLSTGMVLGRSVLRQEGVERALYIDSSALAFWIFMGIAFTYMLLQAIANLPPADGYMIVGAGALSWAAAHGARSGKYL